MKQMKVSDNVHERLEDIKSKEGHTSFDSVIRQLLSEHESGGDGE